jgi:hypothetical protein
MKSLRDELKDFPDEVVSSAQLGKQDALRFFEQNPSDAARVLDAPGHLYEADIPDETIEKMLDWDAPLSEQPEILAKLPDGFLDDMRADFDVPIESISGGHFYEEVARTGDISTVEGASDFLNEAGIPGIRYYDANSRLSAQPFSKVKRAFLKELPEDAEFEDVIDRVGTGHFTKEQDEVIRALEADDWLGFDYPSQAINAAYTDNVRNWDPSDRLLKALDESAGGDRRTRNIVVFNPDDITSVKRDGELVYEAAKPTTSGVGKVEIRLDNPGGEWLEHQRSRAKETGYLGDVTAYLKDHKPVMVNPKALKYIPGARGEHIIGANNQRGVGSKAKAIRESLRSGENIREPIFITVDYRGKALISEGNNRLAVAIEEGVSEIPVEIRWFAGGEQVDGPLSPENLQRLVDETAKPTTSGVD